MSIPYFIRKKYIHYCMVLLFVFIFPLYAGAVCDFDMADYEAYPPFVSSKVAPNIMLILDNSGSMNEFAYHEVSGLKCPNTRAWTGYDPGKEYYGLFNANKCYRYDNTSHYFYVDGATVDDPGTPTIYERSTGSDPSVKKFSGNWLNWWTMRRIDVAKKVLTGGRTAPDTIDLVLEGMILDRDERRIFNDYTTTTDPNGILTGSHAKDVYYTPFHQSFYSYWFNIDRHDHLGGNPNEFVPMFNVVTADFNEVGDLEGTTCVDVPYTDLTIPADPADNGNNTGESGYSYNGYIVAVKVAPEDLPVQGVVQKMAGRVRFGYMQFNFGRGPNEGNSSGADGGRVRNYVGDTATTTDPHGDTVLQLVQNINNQEAETWTPLAEVLWEAVRYFQQVSPAYTPSSPDTPPANNVDYEVNNAWDPYYFNTMGEFVTCAKSFIIFVSDGEATQDNPPTATWPSGGNTNDLTGDGSGWLDDIAFNMHTQDLRDDTLMGETTDIIDQTIALYSVFCFDDSTVARCEMMKAARAGGFIDLNGDGDTAGQISDTDPNAFVGDPEWDADGDNVPDTYFEAQDGGEMEDKLMSAIADILSRTASGTAASVISNARGGEGAIYQAVFFTESEAEPLTGQTIKWYGNVHTLFVDDYGNMHEDTVQDATLDIENDYIIEFSGDTGQAQRYDYDIATDTKTFVDEIDITDIEFIWDALSWLSDPGMNVLTQRTYNQNTHLRYIFTDYIDTSSPVAIANVDSTNQMDFTTGFVNDPTKHNYFFLNPYLMYDHDGNPGTAEVGLTTTEMITEAQNIIKFARGEEGLSETGTGRLYRDRTLDMDGDGTDDTVYRLGDIVHSTPTVVSHPVENYDLLYKDDSYRAFRKKYLNRRIVVYAGANDGMLHAFNGGFYNLVDHKFEKQFDGEIEFDLGAELWAYVPNALLPHLKWLEESLGEKKHVYYVDLKPRIFDARIFSVDSDHPGGWGTVLVGGMRLGGKPIGVDTDLDGTCNLLFSSTYFAIDITNPEVEPDLMWSFTDSNLGFTTSYPTPIRVGSKWFIVFGSGPVDYEATRKDDGIHFTEYGGSNRTASLYILNADDGTLAREFSMDGHSFMADPIAVDFDLVTDPVSPVPTDFVLWAGEAIYIASDGCGA